MVCVAISTFIWFLIALSKDHTDLVAFPVKYINRPEGKLVINKLPDEVVLEVTSHGFALLSYQVFGQGEVLEIDLSQQRVIKRNRKLTAGYIQTASLFDFFAQQLGNGGVIDRDRIYPDTINIVLSDTVRKEVRVVPDVALTFEEEYNLSGPVEVIPPVVEVVGPIAVLDTLQTLTTSKVEAFELEDDFTADVTLGNNAYAHVLSLKQQNFSIHVPVDKFTDTEKFIPIKVRNVPPGYEVKTFPDSIAINYQVGLKNYDRISKNMFAMVAMFPDSADIENTSKLKVDLVSSPPQVKNVRFDKKRVEFILRKK